MAMGYSPTRAFARTPAESTLSRCPGLRFSGLSATEILPHCMNETRCPFPGLFCLLLRRGLEHPVVGQLAEFESLVEVSRQLTWEDALQDELRIEETDHPRVLRGDDSRLLQQGEGCIKHRIVGAIDDALWTPVSVQKILCVIQSGPQLVLSGIAPGPQTLRSHGYSLCLHGPHEQRFALRTVLPLAPAEHHRNHDNSVAKPRFPGAIADVLLCQGVNAVL